MQIFAEYWWIYLLLSFVFIVYAGASEAVRMKRMMDEKPFHARPDGLVSFVVIGLLSGFTFILFLVAIIWLTLHK